jgi:hypothetical protein
LTQPALGMERSMELSRTRLDLFRARKGSTGDDRGGDFALERESLVELSEADLGPRKAEHETGC